MGLSERDLRRVMDVVSPEAVSSDVLEMPEEVLRRLGTLIPCSGVSFAAWDERKREVLTCHRVTFTDDPGWDDGMAQLFWGGYEECVAVSGLAALDEAGQVCAWQDFYSDRAFSALQMSELYRRQGTYHRMMVRLPPRGGVERRLQIGRERGEPGFTDRDKLLLRLLRPHLTGIRDRIQSDRDGAALLTPRQLELLHAVAAGATNRQVARHLGVTESTVRKHLEHVYRRLGVHSRVQAIARVAATLPAR
ncbi:helix-turn-helix transcriptional regulator [Euzebya tangerina]|uniref:helix-turn-helix transcriptional regulator n=1 Tax=Euzebya tangerina TaxID=591198 RepID=UPI0013C3021D|nr:helix-turn-helix transcriptional regulator [Euzebya tangerina]